MIPSIVARQIRDTVLDYLRTTFDLADPEFEQALFDFLDGQTGLFKGPYIDIRLPFRKANPSEKIPLDVKPPFTPYKHQLKSFQRLYSKGGHQPQNTIVTTGTGSGKTECFLYPILDHCLRHTETPGIKAILLYPMNALASDQARRLAQTLWGDDRLRGKVSAGLYVGGQGEHGVADREHLIDKRDMLRASPPDILLTNYKMLDFLLLRPEDRRLWRHNGSDTLRYLVLDELHTYDGAQGSDVACLIRRVKRRLGCAPGTVCAVGTSATIGGKPGEDTIRALTEFATKVFDETFFEDSVIQEERLTAREALGEAVDLERFPAVDDLDQLIPESFPDSESWMRRQAELWIGDDGAALTPAEIGLRLERHDFLRQMLSVLDGSFKSWLDLIAGLDPRVHEWDAFDDDGKRRLLESFIALVSHARRSVPDDDGGERLEPLLTVQAQLWLRELRHLVQQVAPEHEPPRFCWEDEGLPEDHERKVHWLPIAHCRDCGTSGLATFQRESEAVIQSERRAIGNNWLNRTGASRFIAFGHGAEQSDLLKPYLCPDCLQILTESTCGQCHRAEGGERRATIPIRIAAEKSEKKKLFLAQCPDCGSPGALSMLGSRAPSLLSVAIGHLFQSDFNTEKHKKLLAFTDSVQDASHRAGFFGARTYRFNLRTAIQTVVDQSQNGGIPLDQLSDRLIEYWREEFTGRGVPAKLIPTLLPADLRELDTYETYVEKGGSGRHPKLEEQLLKRLSWEVVMEYGLNARVGRTLESTLCSAAAIDRQAVKQASESLKLEIDENSPLGEPLDASEDEVEHFLAGLLQRLRSRGGIDHPMLRSYVESSGAWYLLTKRKQPLMSPFGSQSVLPRYLTDRPRAAGEEIVFDSFVSRTSPPMTWYQDWASRSLGIDAFAAGINDLYREAVERLQKVGLLVRHDVRGRHAWGLDPSRLSATSKLSQVQCSECRRRYTLSEADAARWAGRRCPQYRCGGALEPDPGKQQAYYARIYRSGRLERIYAQEHTGLLDRDQRERIEEDFKAGTRPGAPNLFVCTPTLEMGIDIGDLSSAMLCSVPPSTANYLQRIGRAGRKTGNAFCLTLANSRPHDLYFQAQPEEMLCGQVLPPGCFLDAPEMLQRQVVAHAMDAWARQDHEIEKLPHRVGFLLGEAGKRSFPGRFIEFYRAKRDELTEKFLAMFEDHLSQGNRELISAFARGEAVPDLVQDTFRRVERELKDLKAHQDKARKRIRDIEQNPEIVDDPKLETQDLEDTRKLLTRLIAELTKKYPLNALTDDGVLPNYAFPEPGVRLESVVSHQKENGQREYHAHNYIRPASTAIRELAPFNTFYAEGRKVAINEIDIGTTARPLTETWRLCRECSFTRLEKAGVELEPECPRCSESGWSDSGQVRTMVHFRRSRSLSTRLESSTVDDTDDRLEAYYDTLDLIDVAPEHYNGAKLISEMPFGFELLKNLTLREVNFGPSHRAAEQGFKVCGQPLNEHGFELCFECGRVKNGDEIKHAATCKARKSKTKTPVKEGSVFLYREVQSEAIRILLPVAEVGLDETRASFKAALQLGFRRHFQGDPGHLIVRSIREPIPGGEGARQFLIVFDGVPGGTGYLSELWREQHLLDVLDKALTALQICSCQKESNRDGCYRCLFAYQNQRDLPIISSRKAQKTLREILSQRDSLKTVPTLSDVSLESKLESELEEKFLNALRQRAEESRWLSWEERIQAGELRWILRVLSGGDVTQEWEIRAQVVLDSSHGVELTCRPDFLIQPANGDPALPRIAVFCDGLAFHALPAKAEGRIGDDIRKRRSIHDSGKFQVWSVTWKDVVDFEKERKPSIPLLFEGVDPGKLGHFLTEGSVKISRDLGVTGSMEMLLAFLQRPELDQWRALAGSHAGAWLTTGHQWIAPSPGRKLLERLESETERFEPRPLAQVGLPEATALTRYQRLRKVGWFDCLMRSSMDAISKRRVETVLLRVFDEAPGRADRDFEESWRAWLQAWNMLQFADGVEVLSSEMLASAEYRRDRDRDHAAAADAPPDESVATAPPSPVSPELAECLELATKDATPLIRAAHGAGLQLPENGFELVGDDDRVRAEADLAWVEAKIAVLSESQLEFEKTFESAGWRVFVYPVGEADVLGALEAATN